MGRGGGGGGLTYQSFITLVSADLPRSTGLNGVGLGGRRRSLLLVLIADDAHCDSSADADRGACSPARLRSPAMRAVHSRACQCCAAISARIAVHRVGRRYTQLGVSLGSAAVYVCSHPVAYVYANERVLVQTECVCARRNNDWDEREMGRGAGAGARGGGGTLKRYHEQV